MSAEKQSTEKLFDGIAQFVADSRMLLEQNRLLELRGLDDQVKLLCEAVLVLSQDERMRHAEQLQQLLADLQALGESLVARRDKLAEEMSQIANHKKANMAYRVVEASGHIDPDKESE